MGGEEDRHPAAAERGDQLVDVAGGDRVQAGGGLVEEQHLRVAEQRPGQGDPLAQPFGQRAAGIVGPVDQVDRPQGAVDAIGRVGHLVQVGEALEVLDHAQAQIQARRLGHDRDPPADLHPVVRRQRDPTDERRACRRGRAASRASAPSWSCRRRSGRGTRTPHRGRPRRRRRRRRRGRRTASTDARPRALERRCDQQATACRPGRSPRRHPAGSPTGCLAASGHLSLPHAASSRGWSDWRPTASRRASGGR